MQAKVILRDIRPAAADLIDLRLPVGVYSDARPDGIAVGRGQRSYQNGMAEWRSDVSQQRRSLAHVHDHNLFVAIVVQVSDSEATRCVWGRDAATRLTGQVEELPISAVPIEQPALLELFSGVSRVDFGIHMSIGENEILPSIVIEIDCSRSPPQVSRIHGKAGVDGRVGKVVGPVVAVKSMRVIGKVGLENIESPTVSKVGRRHPHSSLLAPFVVIGYSGLHANLFETLTLEVVKIKARRGIAGNIDIGPAIVVEIVDQRRKAVIVLGRRDVHAIRDIGKVAVSVILVKRDRLSRQTPRTADDRQALPLALRSFSGVRRLGWVEFNVVDDHKIQRAITVEIHKSTPGAPASFSGSQPPGLCLVAESAIALVAIENVLSPLCDEEIDIPIVIDIPGTDALTPSRVRQASLACDIFKLQSAEVVVEQRSSLCAALLEAVAVDKKNVRQAVVIVVEDW